MFIEGKLLYEVLDRCKDLFPEWVREDNRFWNRTTGEIVYENGTVMHDLVYRGYVVTKPAVSFNDTIDPPDFNDSIIVTERSKVELGCLNVK